MKKKERNQAKGVRDTNDTTTKSFPAYTGKL